MLICKYQGSSNSSRKEKCQTDIAGLVSPPPQKGGNWDSMGSVLFNVNSGIML